jgi:cytochrome c oxidase subunit 4
MRTTPLRTYVGTWIALLGLLALTCASSFVPMGRFNLIANVAIAAVKALLVVIFFMRVLKGGPVVRLIAVAGIVWLSLLVILSMNDFALRGP